MDDHARVKPTSGVIPAQARVIPAQAPFVIPAQAGIQGARVCIFAILLLCLLVPRSNAQWLELSTRPAPPPLGADTYAATLAAQLDAEIDQHERSEDPIAQAALNFRRLARALLLDESSDPAQTSGRVIRGIKLHEQRSAVDTALQRIRREQARGQEEPEGVIAGNRAVQRLREFNDLVERRLTKALAGDDHLALLAPLDDALALVSQTPSLRKPSFSALADRAAADESARAVVAEIAEFLERGWSFADLRPQIARWHALVDESLGYLAAVADATWLSESQRSDCAGRMTTALTVFRDPQRRAQGERLLHALIAEAELLRALTALAQSRSYRIDLQPFRAALDRLHQLWGFNAPQPNVDALIDRLNWLFAIAERMNRFRALDRDATPFDLQRVRVQVVDAYLASERAAVKNLDALVSQHRSAVADPALAALLAEHRRLLDDLSRLQGLSRWTDAITLIRPASSVAFADRMRRLAHLLGDGVRRVEAASAMDRVESEIARFWPLPFEDELRLRSRAADLATGGRYRDLLDVLDAHRDHWARELAEHGPALARLHAQRLEALHQLLVAMNDVAELLRHEDAAARLNAHESWWMPPEVSRLAMERLLPILHRAAKAAVEDDEQTLARELSSIEREGAVARLIGRGLANESRLSHADRGDLAITCRYATEALHALAKERTSEARELWRFTNRMAAIVLNGI